nr:hypothetical protein CFP56_13348 [Quercus suber]
MTIGFLDLPCEVRNIIYELVLLRQEPIDCWIPWHRAQRQLGTQLLAVSKTVHREATPIYFGRNCFELREQISGIFRSVLWQVDRPCANQVQHARINFKVFHSEDHCSEFVLTDVLDGLQSRCPDLRTLTVRIYSTDNNRWWKDGSKGPRLFHEKLQILHAAISRFTELEKVIVVIPEDMFWSHHLRPELIRYPWRFKPVKDVDDGTVPEDEPSSCGCDRSEFGRAAGCQCRAYKFQWLLPDINKQSHSRLYPLATRADMAIGFLDLPCEIRNMIYELVLLQRKAIDCFARWDEAQNTLGTQLLAVNKTIHHEATPIFFSRNRFKMLERISGIFSSLLWQVYRRSASQVQHLVIGFRIFRDDDYPDVSRAGLPDELPRDFALYTVLTGLHSRCPNLRTLIVQMYYQCGDEERDHLPIDTSIFEGKLGALDAAVQLFKRLEAVDVQIYDEDLFSHEMMQMFEEYEWNVDVFRPNIGLERLIKVCPQFP